MTMNDTWGYKKSDQNWKSAAQLIRNLIDCASKGGNYLLNVGPTGEGSIPEPSVHRLTEIGRWMKANKASIYGTTASPFKTLPFEGRCTVKDRMLYLHVFNWPVDGLKLTGLATPVRRAQALDGGQRLKVASRPAPDTNGVPYIVIEKPARIDTIATVIELRLAGVLEVTETGK